MALGEWCSMAGEREGREDDEASAARERGWCVCSPAVGIQNARRVWGSPLPPVLSQPTWLPYPAWPCLPGLLPRVRSLLWLQR
jgi:hypothetical protein